MVDINWSLLGGYQNPGDSVLQGYQAGQQYRQQQQTQNALRAYASNPGDLHALAAITATNPVLGMKLQDDARERRLAEETRTRKDHEEQLKIIGGIAKGATDPASWDAGVDQLVGFGILTPEQAMQYKGKFSPETRASIMAAAGVKDEHEHVTTIDGVAFDSDTGKPLFESPYPKVVSGPGGIYVQPRIGLGQRSAGTVQPGHVMSAPGTLPDGWTYEDDGGPGPTSPGGF